MSTYYYKDTVLEELEELGFYNNQYLNKGLNIYTSFNSECSFAKLRVCF